LVLFLAVDLSLKEMEGSDCFTGENFTGDDPFPEIGKLDQ